MAENIELEDGLLAQVSGGIAADDNHGMKEYDAVGEVLRYEGNNYYCVRLDDGGEVMACFAYRHIVSDGTKVMLTALEGGWVMEEAR